MSHITHLRGSDKYAYARALLARGASTPIHPYWRPGADPAEVELDDVDRARRILADREGILWLHWSPETEEEAPRGPRLAVYDLCLLNGLLDALALASHIDAPDR